MQQPALVVTRARGMGDPSSSQRCREQSWGGRPQTAASSLKTLVLGCVTLDITYPFWAFPPWPKTKQVDMCLQRLILRSWAALAGVYLMHRGGGISRLTPLVSSKHRS